MGSRNRLAALAVIAAVAATATGGCIYSNTEKERVVTAPAPPTVAATGSHRVVTYPEGRWTLHGDGTTASPHYWVWVPAGSTPPPPPPVPVR